MYHTVLSSQERKLLNRYDFQQSLYYYYTEMMKNKLNSMSIYLLCCLIQSCTCTCTAYKALAIHRGAGMEKRYFYRDGHIILISYKIVVWTICTFRVLIRIMKCDASIKG